MTVVDIIKARTELQRKINSLKLHDGIGPIANETISWLHQVAWEVAITGKEARFRPKKLRELIELHGVQQVRRWLPSIDGFALGVTSTMELILCPEPWPKD